MKLGQIGIKSVTTWLPATRQTAAAAIANDEVTPALVASLGVTELPVEHGFSAAEMAVLAAQDALKLAGLTAADLTLIAHASVYHQGHDYWPVSHYVAHQLGCPADTLPFAVQQQSNGAALAVQLAVNSLIADPAARHAMVTTADRFGAPVWDRWQSNTSVGYGDGATAAVLHQLDGTPDDFVLLSLGSSTAPEFEMMYRGDAPFSTAPMAAPLDFSARRFEYVKRYGAEDFRDAARRNVKLGLLNALADADVALDDPRVRRVVLPRLGRRPIDIMFGEVVQELVAGEKIQWLGGRTGHLGAGDLLANLADLHDGGDLLPGDIGVVTGGGSGFTWSTVVVQVPQES